MTTISLKEYCPRAKVLSTQDMIKYFVNRESEMMCSDEEMILPEYEEITVNRNWSVGWHNFFRQFVP